MMVAIAEARRSSRESVRRNSNESKANKSTLKKTETKLGKAKAKKLAKNGTKALKKVNKKNLNSSLPLPAPRKPGRFSWVISNLLAGHARPTQTGHLQYLVQHGFKYILTLTQNKPKALKEYTGSALSCLHIPVQDEKPPTLTQIKQFCDAVHKAREEKVALSVHCAWGRGRTGTMLACFLAQEEGLDAQGAIEKIRNIRPGSIDTEQQAAVVHEWVDSLAG